MHDRCSYIQTRTQRARQSLYTDTSKFIVYIYLKLKDEILGTIFATFLSTYIFQQVKVRFLGQIFATFLLEIFDPLTFFNTLKYVFWVRFLQTPTLEKSGPLGSISILPCFH